jgi:hypothetical protein
VEEAKNSVVRIYVEHFDENGRMVANGTGSGFAVGDKKSGVTHIVTNRHVVELEAIPIQDEAGNVTGWIPVALTKCYILTTDMENRDSASLLSVSDRADLAILKPNTPITNRKPITLRPFEKLGNEAVTVIGFPGLADHSLAIDVYMQLLSMPEKASPIPGFVSRVVDASESGRDPYTNLRVGETIQSNVITGGGHSGGPLVDVNGYVVGIHRSSLVDGRSRVTEAVSVNELIPMLDRERVPYILAGPSFNPWLIALILVVIASGAAVVLIVLQMQKQKEPSKPNREGKPTPTQRKLVCTSGVLEGKSFPVGRKIVLGRDPKRCQVRFPNDASGVSGIHCTVRFDGKRVTVTDEKSTYGTYIDDTKLPPLQATVIHRGQTLYLGPKKNGFVLKS